MKTKTAPTIILLCSFALSNYAQINKEEKPYKKWQIAVNVNTVEPRLRLQQAGFLRQDDNKYYFYFQFLNLMTLV